MRTRPTLPGSTTLPALLAILALAACGDDGGSTGGSGAGSQGGESGATTSTGTGAGGSTGQGGGGQGGSTSQGGGAQGGGGSGGGDANYGEITCPDAVPATTTTCALGSLGTSGLLLRGTVLGPDALYRSGQVLVNAAGLIECVGCDCAAGPGADASVVDCGKGVISPGLINTHDHITFANNPPLPTNVRYDHRHEWRKGLNGKPKITTAGTSPGTVVTFAELRFVLSGATSAASAGGAPGLLRNLDQSGRLEGLQAKVVNSDTFPLNDTSGTMQTSGCNYGANPTTEAEIANEEGYLPHIAEGVNAAAHNEFVCTSQSSSMQPGAHDLIAPQTAVIHAVGLRPEDFATMQQDFTSVIWSPRSNISLYGDTARVTTIDALGVPIALGTDWMPSGSMNILRELRCADELNSTYFDKHFSDLALWRMVTENAAMATGTAHAIGSLKPGLVADIAVFDASVRSDFRAVIGAGVEDVALVLRGGEVLYGDAALLDEEPVGGAACETLDVCGKPKKACVAQDIGNTTLSAIRNAGEAIYPLFYCNDTVPADEPTCVPTRPEYSAGITATDGDGDGVPDATDLCPTVFDPIRVMDSGTQPDADGDGVGDACDACPLDAGVSCVAPRADDIDGDGVLNALDNCAEAANADQADADADGEGDACEPMAPAVMPIATVRNPMAPNHPAPGTLVTVTGHVTAVRPDMGTARGFTMQDGTSTFSGITIFTAGTSPGVAVGNEVTVTGTYEEYFGLSELTTPTITVVNNGTTLPYTPLDLAPATLATPATGEAYESMLVRVSTVAILTQNADAPQDFDEFVVTGNLRVNDSYYPAIDNLCAVGSTFGSIAGVMNYSFNNAKLEPRNAADFANASCQVYP